MKRFTIHSYLIILTFLAMAIFPFSSSGADKKVDFNFPQDVASTALTDLNRALDCGDGQQVVDALVRYGIAMSGISQDNMATIISRIDSTLQVEKRPQWRALLLYLEARVYNGYQDRFAQWDRNNPVDEPLPADVSEWDDRQFDLRIEELVNQSLSDPDALRQVSVTSLSTIIRCDKQGALYEPTLLEFLCDRGRELLMNAGDQCDNSRERIEQMWLDVTAGDVPAHIYALCEIKGISWDLAHRYSDNEHCGFVLERVSVDDKEEKTAYQQFNDYVQRFPRSHYANAVRNRAIEMENKRVSLRYPDLRSTTDSITVTATSRNINQFGVDVYRVPDSLLNSRDNYKLSQLKLISQHTMQVQGIVPFTASDLTLTLPPLPYGAYVIVPSFDSEGKRATVDNNRLWDGDLLRVTDLAIMTVNTRNVGQQVAITVDLNDGAPRAGVNVELDEHPTSRTVVTDDEGLAKLGDKSCNLRAYLGEDHYGPNTYYRGRMHDYERNGYSVNFYTDLGVYRPGETVQWAAVLYKMDGDKRSVAKDKRLKATLLDPNDQEIDTLALVTDDYGRVQGSFVIPTDRMNGIFSIRLERSNLMHKLTFNNDVWEHPVTVSEYKTPTFQVSFPDERRNFVAGQPVTIKGQAQTYSGMPLADTQVRLSLIGHEWIWGWWRMHNAGGDHLLDTTANTDAQGNFVITLPADLFEENQTDDNGHRYRWARHNYELQATVTNAAGETQEASTNFIVGTRRGITLQGDDLEMLNDEPIQLPITYNTTDEQHPTTICTWQLLPLQSDQLVKSGNFSTDKPVIDVTDVPSGQYRLQVHILDAEPGEQDVDVNTTITLYHKDDKLPPIADCPLWVPDVLLRTDARNVGHVTVGVSSPQAHIYYVAWSHNRIIKRGWLHLDRGMHDFTVQLPDSAGQDVMVHFAAYYKTQQWEEEVTLTNNHKAQAMHVQVISFRDRLVPGDKEHWTFKLLDQNGKPCTGAMLLDMYDKAIASIESNEWNFANWAPNINRVRFCFMGVDNTSNLSASYNYKRLKTSGFSLPELYLYDEMFFGYRLGRRGGHVMMKMAMPNRAIGDADMEESYELAASMMSRAASADMVADDIPINIASADEELAAGSISPEAKQRLDDVTLRMSDVKTALWLPMLVSDDQGNVSVEFDAPQFNTTWLVQALAYDKSMHGDVCQREVLTQRPLMVRSSLPRFVRQGDKVTLAATVQNATDDATTCDAIIELFDPRTSRVYATQHFNERLAARGTNAISIDWQVPDTLAFVGFRVKAANGSYGDGEQVMLPVLTTISPVIETQPFYVEAAQSHFEQPLPQFPADARVTLEYCDNPVWYCVTALPTIFDDNYGITTAVAHSLFALQVAQGVAKSQPQIRQAINWWKANPQDSTLVSMLEKNQDLKIGTLMASPWLRDAEQQTLRMSRLDQLFDEKLMAQEYEKIITALQDLQMSDGGWTWYRYPNCKSSVWTTGVVLELIGEIKQLGYLPDDNRLTSMTDRAIAYYDSENLRLLNQALKYNKNPYRQFAGYAYVRSLFKEVKQSSNSASMLKKVLSHMNSEWGEGISLKEKAYYAMTLNRYGYSKTACDIIESLRQFAVTTPAMGMYWDNLQTSARGSWWEFDKVAYTSTVLQAMNEVQPRQDEIDRIRKWMLLMKQSNDWGSNSLAADAVYSILRTGSDWLQTGTTPSITVAGKRLPMDDMARYVGYMRTTIPATAAGSVVIDRNGSSPAWGAVYTQFHAPMTQISEVAIDEVSISKEYYAYSADGTLHPVTAFNVGDKVQVRTVIKVLKDMDYVTVTDERAACFEPVDQLSGYRHGDGDWYYHETKDSQTNLFFNSLPKGTHVISYDVWVTAPGEFTSGIATVQCQYAPQLTAHSAGKTLVVEPATH